MSHDPRFLALLRGINVGGKNVIRKDDLRTCFADLGFRDVRTYIQSGNVLFRSDDTDLDALRETIERGLSERFSYPAQAVVLSHRKYAAVVRAAPPGWGSDARRKHYALFTLPGVTPERVMAQLPLPRTDVETVSAGPGVVFWSISNAQQAQTTYAKLPAAAVSRQLTIRNHKTVWKLRDLLEDL